MPFLSSEKRRTSMAVLSIGIGASGAHPVLSGVCLQLRSMHLLVLDGYPPKYGLWELLMDGWILRLMLWVSGSSDHNT